MMRETLFSDAGWLFFAAWSVVVGWVGVAAFGRDLVQQEVQAESEARPRADGLGSPSPSSWDGARSG
jgi:hypothetical protein